MEYGFATWKDIFEVLIVPLTAALVAVLWPAVAARRRRSNFEELIRRELSEAAPNYRGDAEEPLRPAGPNLGTDCSKPWHAYLNRRFLHEDLLSDPVANAELILSLHPELAYNLSQMWISFREAREAAGSQLASGHADQFCWHLGRVAAYLDRKRRGHLLDTVWLEWVEAVEAQYPHLKLGLNLDDRPHWIAGMRRVRRQLEAVDKKHEHNCRRIQPQMANTKGDPKKHLRQ